MAKKETKKYTNWHGSVPGGVPQMKPLHKTLEDTIEKYSTKIPEEFNKPVKYKIDHSRPKKPAYKVQKCVYIV